MTGRDETLGEWYRALLWCYPAGYRRERGEEMVGTLLDGARPGQRWPSPRESYALLVGGLRSRFGTAVRRTAREIWADGFQLAALVILAFALGRAMWWLFWAGRAHGLGQIETTFLPGWERPAAVAAIAVTAAAFLAVARGRVVAAVVLIPVSYLVNMFASVLRHGAVPSDGSEWKYHTAHSDQWLYVVAALAAVAMLRHCPNRTRWSAAALTFIPAGVLIVPDLLNALYGGALARWALALYLVQVMLMVAVLVVALAWSVVDARVAIAIAGPLVAFLVDAVWMRAAYGAGADALTEGAAVIAAILAAAIAAAWLGVRRQSRT